MKKVRLSKSCLGTEEKEAVARVLEAEFLGMGTDVQKFETALQAYMGTKKDVICVNTGTAAIHLAALAIDLGPGDEVLIPTITYLASFQAISATGAKPVAVDVLQDSLFIDLADAEKRITKHTKAILPVHYASDSSRMNAVYSFAEKNNLRVIEDAAHSFGSTRNGQKIGCEGDILCFSFDGIKNITSGEGGAVVTSDKLVAQRIRDARLLGVENDTEKRFSGQRSWDFDTTRQGYRYHMSNIMAAIGISQLAKIDRFGAKRQELVACYRSKLQACPAVEILNLDFENIVSHIFVVKILTGSRDRLRGEMLEKGIESGIHYKPNHLLSLYRSEYPLKTAEKAYDQILSVPLHPDLSNADVEMISDFILGRVR